MCHFIKTSHASRSSGEEDKGDFLNLGPGHLGKGVDRSSWDTFTDDISLRFVMGTRGLCEILLCILAGSITCVSWTCWSDWGKPRPQLPLSPGPLGSCPVASFSSLSTRLLPASRLTLLPSPRAKPPALPREAPFHPFGP